MSTRMCKCYLERVALPGEVLSQNVQHPDHLGEDQDSVASFSEPGQQLVQQHQLPAASYDTLKSTGGIAKIKRTRSEAGTVAFPPRHPAVWLGAGDDPYLQLLFMGFRFSILWLFNKETVVAAFFQLHNDVQEARRAASGAFGKSFVIPC